MTVPMHETPGGPADDDALHRRAEGGMDVELRIGDAELTCDTCGEHRTVPGTWSPGTIDQWTMQHLSPRLVSWTVRAGNQVIDTVTPPPPVPDREGRVWPPPPPNP